MDLFANEEADANVIITGTDIWVEQGEEVINTNNMWVESHICPQVNSKVADVVESHSLDAILCVAGGWAGGNATSPGQLYLCNLAS